jgi:O-palmitoleoyl-L-serine hydrolase
MAPPRPLAAAALALAAATLLPAPAAAQYYDLVLLNLTRYPNARVLDGSPGGFWISRPGPTTNVKKVIIHHQGGGWCVSIDDCFSRANTFLGSSTFWAPANCTAGSSQQPCGYDGGTHGFFSTDPAVAPLFADAVHVYVAYGDGGSYSGRVADPVPVPGQPASKALHFKGSWVLEAIYDTLLTQHGLAAASDVVIGGTSAGGLSIYLTIDRVAAQIKAAAAAAGNPGIRVTGAPDAGFFLDIPSFAGPTVYTPHYQWVAQNQNVTGTINDACVAAVGAVNASETWRCFLAEVTLPYISTPLFITNSLVDAWQASNIMDLPCTPSSAPVRVNALAAELAAPCAAPQYKYLADFSTAMLQRMVPQLSTASAAFLVECFVHPVADNDHYWGGVTVAGTTAGQLFAQWYAGGARDTPLVAADTPVWGSNKC